MVLWRIVRYGSRNSMPPSRVWPEVRVGCLADPEREVSMRTLSLLAGGSYLIASKAFNSATLWMVVVIPSSVVISRGPLRGSFSFSRAS